jgi:hypothetical protein
MTLTLTMQQRLNLEAIIRDKRYTDIDDAVIMHSALGKIKVPIDIRTTLVRDLSDGRSIVDLKALAISPTISIDLESAEVLKLITRLEEWRKEKGISADDVDWYVPLVKDLTQPSPARK